jgi:hypothetical protein
MLRGSTPALLAAALVGAGVVVVATRRPPLRAAPPVKPRDPGDEPQVPPQPPADSAELWERERKVAKLPPRGVGDLLEREFASDDRGAPLAPATTESLWPVRTKARSYLQVSCWSGKGLLVWRDRTSPPDRLLDPSAYLLQASENQYLRDQGVA